MFFPKKLAVPRLQDWKSRQPPPQQRCRRAGRATGSLPRASPAAGTRANATRQNMGKRSRATHAGQQPPHKPPRAAAGRRPSDTATPDPPQGKARRTPRTADGAPRPSRVRERSGSGCDSRRQSRGTPSSPQAARQSICSGNFSRIGTCSKASCMTAAAPGPADEERNPARREDPHPARRGGAGEEPRRKQGRRHRPTARRLSQQLPRPPHHLFRTKTPPPRPGAAAPPALSASLQGGPPRGGSRHCQGGCGRHRAPAARKTRTVPAAIEQPASAAEGSGSNGKRGSERPAPTAAGGARFLSLRELSSWQKTLVHLHTVLGGHRL